MIRLLSTLAYQEHVLDTEAGVGADVLRGCYGLSGLRRNEVGYYDAGTG